MSEKITSSNLENVVHKNIEIHDDLMQKTLYVRMYCNNMQVNSSAQLAFQLLKTYGLIQLPIENQYWSGAIFVKGNIRIPVINTALPRANQYFAAWHEIYHLLFDAVSFVHVIDSDSIMEERKAEYFASLMLLGNLMPYFMELPEMDFTAKVFHCMDVFQAPYKAVLISLFESAVKSENRKIMDEVKQYFDVEYPDLASRFKALGLDDTLVRPSNLVNLGFLQTKILAAQEREPNIRYHKENALFLQKVLREISETAGGTDG